MTIQLQYRHALDSLAPHILDVAAGIETKTLSFKFRAVMVARATGWLASGGDIAYGKPAREAVELARSYQR